MPRPRRRLPSRAGLLRVVYVGAPASASLQLPMVRARQSKRRFPFGTSPALQLMLSSNARGDGNLSTMQSPATKNQGFLRYTVRGYSFANLAELFAAAASRRTSPFSSRTTMCADLLNGDGADPRAPVSALPLSGSQTNVHGSTPSRFQRVKPSAISHGQKSNSVVRPRTGRVDIFPRDLGSQNSYLN